ATSAARSSACARTTSTYPPAGSRICRNAIPPTRATSAATCPVARRPSSVATGPELAAAHDRLAGELVAALVLGDAGVSGDLDEARVGKPAEPNLDARDELLIGLRLPALREHADRVARVGVDGDLRLALVG